ncbi:MAG: methyltransferase domain-containing protein [Candidatus Uhrbacteria bacterium]
MGEGEKDRSDEGFCEHGNLPSCLWCAKVKKIQSTREYAPSPAILALKEVRPETKVLLIGDGQGSDTGQFLKMGVEAGNISLVNYEPSEVETANRTLNGRGVTMRQADATSIDSLYQSGIEDASQDLITLMHVLEVPDIRGDAERRLVENVARVLRDGGEAIVSQYKKRLTPEEAKSFGVEEIRPSDLEKRFGEDWAKKFQEQYGQPWEEGMRYSEISNIRSKEELVRLFGDVFDVTLEETGSEYVLKLKKK